MGFMDLPGRLDGKEPWRTAEFHREQFRKYGVRYDVFSEGSGSIAAALKSGAELLNPTAKDLGRRPSVSLVDPAYVEAQCAILRKLGAQLRGEPFVGYLLRQGRAFHPPARRHARALGRLRPRHGEGSPRAIRLRPLRRAAAQGEELPGRPQQAAPLDRLQPLDERQVHRLPAAASARSCTRPTRAPATAPPITGS